MVEPLASKPGRVVISGWYGHENVGDEAMLTVLLEAFERGAAGARFAVLSERPERVQATHGRGDRLIALDHPIPYSPARMLDVGIRRATARIREEVRGASLFVLGGGSLLRDRGRGNFLRLVDELAWAQRADVPTAVVGVSAGPLRRILGRALAKRLLSRVDLLSVRDEESRRVLRDLGVDESRVSFDGDLTLALDPGPATENRSSSPVLVAPCRAMLTGLKDGARGNPELEVNFAQALDTLVSRTGVSIEFVPFRCAPDEDDAALSERIVARMSERSSARVAEHSLDALAVKRRFASAPLVLAARLHALHFALSGGTPTVAVAYGQKIGRMYRDLSLADFALEPKSATRSKLLERLDRARDHGAVDFERARKRLAEQATRVQAMLARLADLPRA